jgi:predicted DNA-binding transcriptional regulator YafY
MSSAETLRRQWGLLRRIPRYPRRISTSDLHASLSNQIDVSLRTIQRDLQALSVEFPLNVENEGRKQFWFWTADAAQLEIPGMTGSMAATLLLAREYLQPILPASVLNDLNPFFNRAKEVLEPTKLSHWNKKVRILERGPMLIAPRVNSEVLDVVHQGLLQEKQIRGRYKGRNKDKHKEYVLNPLGMVVKGGVFYLVVVFDGHEDIRQLALHRMNKAELLDEDVVVPKGYSLKHYVEDDEGFSYPLSPEKIRLELLFDADAAFHLTETKLSPDQTVEFTKDGRMWVKATVADSDELRWWIRGYGNDVEVRKPVKLARELSGKKGVGK